MLSSLLLAVVLLAGPGTAPASAATDLEVTTPADGRHQPGRPTPVLVTLRSDEAVRGTLSVSFEGSVSASEVVELAGGTAKTVTLVVSTLPWGPPGLVRFSAEGDGDDASAQLQLDSAGGDELVAVLPGSAGPGLPATAELAVELGQARFYPVDTELLDLGPDGLGPFNQLLTTAEELNGLSPDQLASLDRWVRSDGGRLVIDDDPAAAVPLDLGAAADPIGRSTVALGLGSVRFTDGSAAAGDFDGLLDPTQVRSADELPFAFSSVDPALVLARDAGFAIPSIANLVLLLLVYAVAVGPVAWLVLRRGRREPIMWLVIPAVAVVATLGIYGAGRVLRGGTRSSHATLAIDLPGSHIEVTEALVARPGGGQSGLTLDEGWIPISLSDPFLFDPSSGRRSQELIDGRLVTQAATGGAGTVTAQRAGSASDPAWDLDLVVEGEDLVGAITNRTDHELREVVVSSGTGVAEIDRVGPGETVDVTVKGATGAAVENDDLSTAINGPDPWSGRATTGDGVGNPALLTGWLARHPDVTWSGRVLVLGWTGERAGPLPTSDGDTIEVGRTAYVTIAELPPEAGLDRIEVLRGWGTVVTDQVNQNGCVGTPVTYRIHTDRGGADGSDGAGGPGGSLALRADPKWVAGFDVWDGTEWAPAGMADRDGGEARIPLPAGALNDGQVYVRALTTCDAWGAEDVLPRLVTGGDDA